MSKEEDNPKRTVYGMGYLGVGDYKAGSGEKGMSKEYILWTNMLSRCYGKPYRNNPSNPQRYEDCTVCEEWHNFQNFAKWCNEQPNFGRFRYSLDKDLMEFGNTVYCPSKCCILSPSVNSAIKMVTWKQESDLPIGVHRHTSGAYQSSLKGETKYSSDSAALSVWYVEKKKKVLRELAETFKEEIPEVVYDNLTNWAPN